MPAFLFMHRLASVVAIDANARLDDEDDFGRPAAPDQRADLPPDVEAYQVTGPLFFAVANRLDEVLDQIFSPPKVFIQRLRLVPMIDASGAAAFARFLDRAHKLGIKVVLSGLQPQPRAVLARMHALDRAALAADVPGFEQAVPAARGLVGQG
jgi:SulP family sulfate permease